MPRKKNNAQSDVEQNSAVTVEPPVVALQEGEVAVNTEKSPQKQKLPRVVVPKKEFIMILDGGRSQIKTLTIVDGEVKNVVVIESTICQVDAPPFGEQGAFSTSRKKIEIDGKQRDEVEHWIVGTSAKLQSKDYITMSDGENHKVEYFPILVLGAIASLPNLYDLSTGANEKNRSLSIKLITLSLANPTELRRAIKQCRWMKVDGVKYSLSFSKDALNYPEGYGASLYGQGDKLDRPTLYTFDIGFGTACVSEYNNLGKLPKRVSHKPNGGGGVATLIREFAEAVANSDSARMIKPSQLREILFTATYEDGKVKAIAPDGRDVGDALKAAITNWIKDSPLTFAIESLGIQGRKHPVILCGGGFAIPPAREMVKTAMIGAGIPAPNLIEPEQPGIVALSEMRKLYIQSQQEIVEVGSEEREPQAA